MSKLERNLFGTAALAGPALLVLSTLLAMEAGAFRRSAWAATVQIYAFIGLAVVIVGLSRMLAARSEKVGLAVLVLGLVGVAGGVGFAMEAMYVASGAPRMAESQDPSALLGLNMPGVVFPLAMVVTGISLVRAKGGWPVWAGAVVALAGVMFPVSRIGNVVALALVADGLLLLGLGAMGLWLISESTATQTGRPAAQASIG